MLYRQFAQQQHLSSLLSIVLKVAGIEKIVLKHIDLGVNGQAFVFMPGICFHVFLCAENIFLIVIPMFSLWLIYAIMCSC